MHKFLISEYFSAKDNTPKPRSLTWTELVSRLQTFEKRDEKDGPAWSPTVFSAPLRANKNVHSLTCAVFDLDNLGSKQARWLEELLSQEKVSCVLHTTYSHDTPNSQCFRLVMELKESVRADDWEAVRTAIIQHYELPVDENTKDLARLYYYPACPPKAEGTTRVFEGMPLDVTKLLEKGATPSAVEEEESVFEEIFDIAAVKKKLQYLNNPMSRALIRRVLQGEPLAKEGERDASMYQLASILGFRLPDVPDEVIVEVVRPSLAAMPSDLGLDKELDKFREKLTRVRSQQKEYAKVAAQKLDDIRKQDILDATGGDTEQPYTPQQLEELAKNHNCSLREFLRRLVIQKANSYYVFSNGQYTPSLTRDELENNLHVFLAQAPIEWEVVTARGKRRKSVSQILQEYSTTCFNVVADMAIQKSYYEPKTRTFYEAVCPIKSTVEAQYHEDVHKWLMALGGKDAHKLLDWVACATRLERQCAALFLEGDAGAGKGLLAHGLSRLWRDGGATPFEALVADFNDAVTSCPMVLVDEGFPKHRHYSIIDELRKWTGNQNQNIKRKFKAEASLRGAIRLILAANNNRIFESIEELSENDRIALAERLIYIKITKQARLFLESLEYSEREEFVNEKIAQHSVWLRENREVVSGKRFIVEGNDSALHARLMVSNSVAGLICEFLAKSISEATPKMKESLSEKLKWGNGEVWVVVQAFQDRSLWDNFVPGNIFPTSATLYRALQNLRVARVKIERTALKRRGPNAYYSVISLARLLEWVEIHSDLEADYLAELVKAPNEAMNEFKERIR